MMIASWIFLMLLLAALLVFGGFLALVAMFIAGLVKKRPWMSLAAVAIGLVGLVGIGLFVALAVPAWQAARHRQTMVEVFDGQLEPHSMVTVHGVDQWSTGETIEFTSPSGDAAFISHRPERLTVGALLIVLLLVPAVLLFIVLAIVKGCRSSRPRGARSACGGFPTALQLAVIALAGVGMLYFVRVREVKHVAHHEAFAHQQMEEARRHAEESRRKAEEARRKAEERARDGARAAEIDDPNVSIETLEEKFIGPKIPLAPAVPPAPAAAEIVPAPTAEATPSGDAGEEIAPHAAETESPAGERDEPASGEASSGDGQGGATSAATSPESEVGATHEAANAEEGNAEEAGTAENSEEGSGEERAADDGARVENVAPDDTGEAGETGVAATDSAAGVAEEDVAVAEEMSPAETSAAALATPAADTEDSDTEDSDTEDADTEAVDTEAADTEDAAVEASPGEASPGETRGPEQAEGDSAAADEAARDDTVANESADDHGAANENEAVADEAGAVEAGAIEATADETGAPGEGAPAPSPGDAHNESPSTAAATARDEAESSSAITRTATEATSAVKAMASSMSEFARAIDRAVEAYGDAKSASAALSAVQPVAEHPSTPAQLVAATAGTSEAPAAESPHSERPRWTKEPPKRIGDTEYKVIATDEYATERECQQAADILLLLATYEHLNSLVGHGFPTYTTQPAIEFRSGQIYGDGEALVLSNGHLWDHRLRQLQSMGVTPDFIRREIVAYGDDGLQRSHLETVSRSFGDMHKLFVQARFTPSADEQLRRMWNGYRRGERMAVVGAGGVGILALLGMVWGALKFDTMTKGYYTKRIFLGIPLGVLAMLGLYVMLVEMGFDLPH